MLESRKPQPLCQVSLPKRCPVCRQSSYSPSGIHPQCAMRQADNERMARLKAAGQSITLRDLRITLKSGTDHGTPAKHICKAAAGAGKKAKV